MQGKIINGFELKKFLGTGGVAEVWLAENEFHEPAIVRILDADSSKNTQIVERFPEVVELMVVKGHQVFGSGTIDGRPAIVMEYNDKYEIKIEEEQEMILFDEEYGWMIRDMILDKETDECITIQKEMQIVSDDVDYVIDLVDGCTIDELDGIIDPWNPTDELEGIILNDDLVMRSDVLIMDDDTETNDKNVVDTDDSLIVSVK